MWFAALKAFYCKATVRFVGELAVTALRHLMQK